MSKCFSFLLLTLVSATTSVALAEPARLLDADTIELDGKRYRLWGIDAPETGQRYGKQARAALRAILAGKKVSCDNRGTDEYGRILSRCVVNGKDISAAMVRGGHAWAYVKFSQDYVGQEKSARLKRIGMWKKGKHTPPWEFRANGWAEAAQIAPNPKCPIKGNISKRGRIYHMPWSRSYRRTKITISKGERWFCDENEALKAGWRAPYYDN